MNTSGDAAEQIVRLSLEGTEVALKLTGSAAKNIAAMIYAILKDQKRTKGKAKIESMIRTERPMTAYTIKREDCLEFQKRAKEYGILFCPIPYKKTDETVDILVFESDAARVNRIVDRFKFSVVDTASIKRDIERSKTEKGKSTAPLLPNSRSPTRRRTTACLTIYWEHPFKRRKPHPKTQKQAKPLFFKKRRRHPIRPRLPQRSKAEPPRVLLNHPKNAPLFVKNCGKSRRNSKRWRLPLRKNQPFPKSRPNSRRPPTNNRPEKRNPNQRRDNR